MSTKWTSEHIENLKSRGMTVIESPSKKIPVEIPAAAPSEKNKELVKLMKEEPRGIQHIKLVLTEMGLEYEEEIRFHKVKRYRFDLALFHERIAIEYEGLMSEKSGHTTLRGFTKDCKKYNLATINDWKMLRYTWKNYKDFRNDINEILKREL